jgi:hypothetical protein
MYSENEKGAAVNDAREKSTHDPILGANNKDRNLIRQVRRRLKKEGLALRKVEDGYAVVHQRIVFDEIYLARLLGVPLCELCSDGAARVVVNRKFVCRGCESELKGGAL